MISILACKWISSGHSLVSRCLPQSYSSVCDAQVSKWCIVFAGIGAGAIVMGMLQQYGFGCMGQRLTRRLRVLLFTSMFRQVSLAAMTHAQDNRRKLFDEPSGCSVSINTYVDRRQKGVDVLTFDMCA